MNLELGIKRRLSYLFAALAVTLIGALVFTNAEVQSARKLELAVSTHNVFERILSEALKTNDVPEMSRLLKRSLGRDRAYFAYDADTDQLVLPNYAQMDDYRKLLAETGRCLAGLITVEFAGRRHELFCDRLDAEAPTRHFVLYQLMPAEPIAPARFIWISLGIAGVSLVLLWFVLSKIMNDQLFRPIEELERYLERHIGSALNDAAGAAPPGPRGGPAEIERLRQTFDDLLGRAKASFALEKKILESGTKERIARQVAHDIRSPLSALNMVFARFDQVGEDGRALAQKAVQRINDIANDLLRGSQVERAGEISAAEPVLVESEIDGVVSETRAVFANRPGLEITFDQRVYPRSFVTVRPGELRRALANLIINSVEALEPKRGGGVHVTITSDQRNVVVAVTDDGIGIAPERLGMVGQPGYSFGKTGESGSGLGLSYAKDFTARAGGRLDIRSAVGCGTTVTMTFPAVAPPAWYLATLAVRPGATVVVLDDDQSVHQMWRNIFAARADLGVNLVCLSSGAELAGRRETPGALADALYLIDFELAAGEPTGLDLIAEHALGPRSILVTSRFDDVEIIRRCREAGVRQIPKMAAGLIPIVAQR